MVQTGSSGASPEHPQNGSVEDLWQVWVPKLYRLQGDKRARHERLRNPALLLALIDVLDAGECVGPEFAVSRPLRRIFNIYFDIVRQEDDRWNYNIWMPLERLAEHGFCRIIGNPPPATDPQQTLSDEQIGAQSVEIVPEFWRLLADPTLRKQVQQLIIARYFPWKRPSLQNFTEIRPIDIAIAFGEKKLFAIRQAAFADLLLDIYSDRCCACGAPSIHGQKNTASHLIPFEIAHNDHPTNAIVLCPAHLSAFKANVLAPVPAGSGRLAMWQLNPHFRTRKNPAMKWLLDVQGCPVLPPSEKKYLPAASSVEWTGKRLASAPMSELDSVNQ